MLSRCCKGITYLKCLKVIIMDNSVVAVESLVIHLSKSTKRYLEEGLLVRLIRAGLTVPLFTEKQKLIVLSVSHLVCPKDLESFVFNPPEVEDASPNICSVSKGT